MVMQSVAACQLHVPQQHDTEVKGECCGINICPCPGPLLQTTCLLGLQCQKTPVKWQVKVCVNSDSFWAHTAAYCKLLAPFADALSGIVSGISTLANIMLHWLHLAKLLQAAATQSSLPQGQDTVACCLHCNACLMKWLCTRKSQYRQVQWKDVMHPLQHMYAILSQHKGMHSNVMPGWAVHSICAVYSPSVMSTCVPNVQCFLPLRWATSCSFLTFCGDSRHVQTLAPLAHFCCQMYWFFDCRRHCKLFVSLQSEGS